MGRHPGDTDAGLGGGETEVADSDLTRLNEQARAVAAILRRSDPLLVENPFGPYCHRLRQILAGGRTSDAHALLVDLDSAQARLRGRLGAPPDGGGDVEIRGRASAILFLECIAETRRCVERAWRTLDV